VAQLGIVEAAGNLLAVARDERHCRALIKKCHGRFDLLRADAEFFGDAAVDTVHKHLTYYLCRAPQRRADNPPRQNAAWHERPAL
jgi:hypothetical protein